MTLPRDRQAPSLARAALAGFAAQRRLSQESISTLALLVSELVSNAVLHSDAPASSAIQLCARLLGHHAVRIEVTDEGSGFDAAPRDPARLEGGYGLYLVDTQSSSWGVDTSDGTCVWFELAQDHEQAELQASIPGFERGLNP